jgi:predicted nucleotide-binding protein (sugar kinase/HSP70/actin superfamily)
MAQSQDIDGIIYVACFGCGPDSMVGEIIERKIAGKPYMLITVDEHTGEAGLVTRLEAFCDMLKRRRIRNGADHFSPHG